MKTIEYIELILLIEDKNAFVTPLFYFYKCVSIM